MNVKQFHLRVADEELIASIRHEQARSGSASDTATVLELIRDGLLLRRSRREQEAWDAWVAGGSVLHDVNSGGADVEQEEEQSGAG